MKILHVFDKLPRPDKHISRMFNFLEIEAQEKLILPHQ